MIYCNKNKLADIYYYQILIMSGITLSYLHIQIHLILQKTL
jgi:hypothetical protein